MDMLSGAPFFKNLKMGIGRFPNSLICSYNRFKHILMWIINPKNTVLSRACLPLHFAVNIIPLLDECQSHGTLRRRCHASACTEDVNAGTDVCRLGGILMELLMKSICSDWLIVLGMWCCCCIWLYGWYSSWWFPWLLALLALFRFSCWICWWRFSWQMLMMRRRTRVEGCVSMKSWWQLNLRFSSTCKLKPHVWSLPMG